jgi:hypothetical protein
VPRKIDEIAAEDGLEKIAQILLTGSSRSSAVTADTYRRSLLQFRIAMSARSHIEKQRTFQAIFTLSFRSRRAMVEECRRLRRVGRRLQPKLQSD